MRARSTLHPLVVGGLAASLMVGTLVFAAAPASAEEHAEHAKSIHCTMDFTAEAWAFFLGKGHGEGHIHCDNGQAADAVIKAKTAGIEFGEMKVDRGKGDFADLSDIGEIWGKYMETGASAAAGDTAAAGALLKMGGKVKLAFSGVGEGGGGIGRNWGIVSIERK